MFTITDILILIGITVSCISLMLAIQKIDRLEAENKDLRHTLSMVRRTK